MTTAASRADLARPHPQLFETIERFAGALRAGECTVAGTLDECLARIATANPTLHAFSFVDEGGARRAAAELDRELTSGRDRGPLHGVTLAVKDLFATSGHPTTASSRLLAGSVTAEDALVVGRLRAAGAIVVGKTHMNEFAFGVTGLSEHFGPVRNPWGADRIVGGSSSGSAAAVAAGLCFAAIGTDTGGSIRIPASLTGVVGFKPTYDLLSRDGVLPLAESLDHVGPMARSVNDVFLLLRAMAGWSGDETPPRIALEGLRMGILEDHCRGLDPEVDDAWRALLVRLERSGARTIPLPGDSIAELMVASTVLMFAEAADVHRLWLRDRRSEYEPATRIRLLQGALLPATTYAQAERLRRRLRDRVERWLDSVDVIASPTQPAIACRIEEVTPDHIRRMLRNTRLAPLIGVPAVTIPLPTRGLPIGLQLVGRAGGDREVLGGAAAIESTLTASSRGEHSR